MNYVGSQCKSLFFLCILRKVWGGVGVVETFETLEVHSWGRTTRKDKMKEENDTTKINLLNMTVVMLCGNHVAEYGTL